MGLREYVNDLEFCRKFNCSEWGRKFEYSDFARSVELSKMFIGMLLDKESVEYNMVGTTGILAFPVFHLITYGYVKGKKLSDSFSYKHLIGNQNFVLNH